MSGATNPEDKQSKPVGISKKILSVNYFPTLAIFDNVTVGTRHFPLNSPETEAGDQYYDIGSGAPAGTWDIGSDAQGGADADLFIPEESSPMRSPRSLKDGRDYFRVLARKYWIDTKEGDFDTRDQTFIMGPSFYYSAAAGSIGNKPWEPEWHAAENAYVSPGYIYPMKKIMDQNRSPNNFYNIKKNWTPFSVFIEDHSTGIPPNKALLDLGWTKGTGYYQQMVIYHDKMKPDGELAFASNYDVVSKFEFENLVGGYTGDAGSSTLPIVSCNLKYANGPFFDHVHEYNYPTSLKEIKELGIPTKTLYADIKTNYNFYIKEYEAALNTITTDLEPFLPSLGVLSTAKYAPNIPGKHHHRAKPPKEYRTLIALKDMDKNGTNPPELEYTEDLTHFDLTKYYRNWSQVIQKNVSYIEKRLAKGTSDWLYHVKRQAKEVVIPPNMLSILGQASEERSRYPLYTEIEFATDPNNKIGDLLNKNNLWANLVSYVVATANGETTYTTTKSGQLVGVRNFVSKFEGMPLQEITTLPGENTNNKQITNQDFSSFNTRGLNLNDWLTNIISKNKGIYNPALRWNQYFFLDPSRSLRESAKDRHLPFKLNDLEVKLQSIAFAAGLDKIVKPYFRDYKGILEGKKCYNETVFYRVEKRNAVTGNVVQNFYFLNTSEFDVINYVDTQVFYNKKYEYKIYAWNLVVGTEYKYNSIAYAHDLNKNPTKGNNWKYKKGGFTDFASKLDDDTQWAAHIDMVSFRSLMLLEMPYYNHQALKVIDNPPVPPGVDIVPYRAVTDKVLIQLTNEMGEYYLDPVIINADEASAIKKLREDKGYGPKEKILYKTDDFYGSFQIFRTTSRPSSYEDFIGKQIIELDNKTEFIDEIKSNVKYYYTFRIIDNHGHMSNPSSVYEFELVRNVKAVYPHMRVYHMEDLEKEALEEGKMIKKSLSKYMYIQPTTTQTELNYEGLELLLGASKTAENAFPKIGFENESLMGKKFKIRLTSKLTGRRTDFNLTFKSNTDPVPKTKPES